MLLNEQGQVTPNQPPLALQLLKADDFPQQDMLRISRRSKQILLKLANQTYENAKKRLKTILNEKFANGIDRIPYSLKCWSEYRFK